MVRWWLVTFCVLYSLTTAPAIHRLEGIWTACRHVTLAIPISDRSWRHEDRHVVESAVWVSVMFTTSGANFLFALKEQSIKVCLVCDRVLASRVAERVTFSGMEIVCLVFCLFLEQCGRAERCEFFPNSNSYNTGSVWQATGCLPTAPQFEDQGYGTVCKKV